MTLTLWIAFGVIGYFVAGFLTLTIVTILDAPLNRMGAFAAEGSPSSRSGEMTQENWIALVFWLWWVIIIMIVILMIVCIAKLVSPLPLKILRGYHDLLCSYHLWLYTKTVFEKKEEEGVQDHQLV